MLVRTLCTQHYYCAQKARTIHLLYMNTKAILSLLVVVLLAGGGYYVYQNYSGTMPDQSVDTNQEVTDTVQAQDVTEGTGKEAAPGSVVSILYVGRLEDGTVFDSSEAHDNQPLTFQLGTPGIIAGFQIGVNGMKEGGERRLAVPASLGYGAQDVRDPDGNVIIPANSTLIFDIKLVSVQEAPAESPESAPAEETE